MSSSTSNSDPPPDRRDRSGAPGVQPTVLDELPFPDGSGGWVEGPRDPAPRGPYVKAMLAIAILIGVEFLCDRPEVPQQQRMRTNHSLRIVGAAVS